MSKPIIVWYRNDLRVHDHPALYSAAENATHVIPVFIFNKDLLHGRHAGSNRNRFLLESLENLRKNLQKLGANLVIRAGEASGELQKLAKEVDAKDVYYTVDFTAYAIKRDKTIKEALEAKDINFRSFGGRLAVDSLNDLHTKTGKPHKVFTPFWRNWQDIQRRPVVGKPHRLALPDGIKLGELPKLDAVSNKKDLSPDVMPGGETAGRERMQNWLNDGVQQYHNQHNEISQAGTSRLSPYLHFGCVSVRELEEQLPQGAGAGAFHRQLAWRDFYHYIIFKFPDNASQEFQERYRKLKWNNDQTALAKWQKGQTGYPIVDACMRQLNTEGWMHNRGRLIVGSFLTKDLWLDWRAGETYFMRMLMDGDEANNNGNWQWIASVGVDPAPVFRRLYNPTLQGERYDADGTFIKQFVPELKDVPIKYLSQPWKMPEELQAEANCIIGTDYPEPVVDHAEARQFALEQYRNTAG